MNEDDIVEPQVAAGDAPPDRVVRKLRGNRSCRLPLPRPPMADSDPHVNWTVSPLRSSCHFGKGNRRVVARTSSKLRVAVSAIRRVMARDRPAIS
jgi:hypothetical protein